MSPFLQKNNSMNSSNLEPDIPPWAMEDPSRKEVMVRWEYAFHRFLHPKTPRDATRSALTLRHLRLLFLSGFSSAGQMARAVDTIMGLYDDDIMAMYRHEDNGFIGDLYITVCAVIKDDGIDFHKADTNLFLFAVYKSMGILEKSPKPISAYFYRIYINTCRLITKGLFGGFAASMEKSMAHPWVLLHRENNEELPLHKILRQKAAPAFDLA